MRRTKEKLPFVLAICVAVLVAFVSVIGLTTDNFYYRETANWISQAIGQDIADLFLITPFLLVTSFLAYRGSKTGILLSSGSLAYLIYTFVIYGFAIHFNPMYLFYCAILGLSFYSLLIHLIKHSKKDITKWFSDKTPVKTSGIFLIILALNFYGMWLAEIIPASLTNTTPKCISEIGALTNPVHTLDLSIVLPSFIIIGILLLRKNSFGYLLAPTALTFSFLMDITIGLLSIIMERQGVTDNHTLAYIMVVFASINGIILVRLLNGIVKKR